MHAHRRPSTAQCHCTPFIHSYTHYLSYKRSKSTFYLLAFLTFVCNWNISACRSWYIFVVYDLSVRCACVLLIFAFCGTNVWVSECEQENKHKMVMKRVFFSALLRRVMTTMYALLNNRFLCIYSLWMKRKRLPLFVNVIVIFEIRFIIWLHDTFVKPSYVNCQNRSQFYWKYSICVLSFV